jgi:hypothetical protein
MDFPYMVGFCRFVAVKNIFNILSLSTHGLFFTDQGPGLQAGATGRGYRQDLQAWAGASKGAKTPKK